MNYTLFSNWISKNSSRENRLLHLDIGKMFSTKPGERTEQLNDIQSSSSHNKKMIEGAGEEIQTPLSDTVKGAQEEMKKKFSVIPGVLTEGLKGTLKAASSVVTTPISAVGKTAVNLVSGTTKIATHIITNSVGFALNIPRIGGDIIKLATRPPIVVADYFADLLGRPSRWMKKLRGASLKKIDDSSEKVLSTSSGFRDKLLGAAGLGDGGHGHGHGGEAHGHH